MRDAAHARARARAPARASALPRRASNDVAFAGAGTQVERASCVLRLVTPQEVADRPRRAVAPGRKCGIAPCVLRLVTPEEVA
eukprot:COSAG02_NODE_4008_length_5920_cov_4.372960_1_plen_82_part_10